MKDNESALQEVKVSLKDVENLREEAAQLLTIEEIRALLDTFILKYKNQDFIHEELIKLQDEINVLENQKNEYGSGLELIRNNEEEITIKINVERAKLEDEGRATLQSERELMMVGSEVSLLEEEIRRLNSNKVIIEEEQNIYKIDLQELAMLLGQDLLSFETLSLENQDLENLNTRTIQHERKRFMERLKIRLEEAGVANYC